MLRHRCIGAAIAATIVFCAGLTYLAARSTEPGITLWNFYRLEVGMTRAQADEILGGPPRLTAPNGRNWFGLMLM